VAPLLNTAVIPRISKADTYYLQLGAYASEKVAQDLAASLPSSYPALVVAPASTGAGMFRVLIGPLNRAESGTVLTRFRYRGFPDAFLKKE
jgi:cell division septation protein DedD